MAGDARTSSFVLGAATVMLGPQASLLDLTASNHSIGLVKNFTVTAEPEYLDLTQGIKNTIVYSVLTRNPIRATCEVYEFTSKNLAYGLGLDGAALTAFSNEYDLKAAITGNTATPVTTLTFDAADDVTAEFPAGAWVSIQDPTNTDNVHYVKLSAAATKTGTAPTITHTLTFANFGFKTGNNMPLGAKVQRVNRTDVGSKTEQPFLACKVIGILPERNEPVGFLMPKVRITRGFNVAFTTDNFANMPFQIQPYDLVATDPFYSEFGAAPVAMYSPT